MCAEPRDLIAVEVGDPERIAVGRRPDRLDHVAEIEAARHEAVVAEHRQGGEAGGPRGGRDRNKGPRGWNWCTARHVQGMMRE